MVEIESAVTVTAINLIFGMLDNGFVTHLIYVEMLGLTADSWVALRLTHDILFNSILVA